jgi:hypothetical protein
MMAAPIVLMLVARDAVMKGNLAGQTAFGEQLESSIHGGEAYLRILLLHQPEQFVGGKVFPRFQEGAQDSVPLLSVLQANALQVPMEDLLSFPNHLTRDAGLIIDSFLQAGWQSSRDRVLSA